VVADEAILVYQAFKPEIGKYAVEHQRFTGCPGYSSTRMTWIKPNFLWMMFRYPMPRTPATRASLVG
jgi:hypothetical protein